MRNIHILLLYLTLGYSQASSPVSLGIANINFDINVCSDPSYTTQAACEVSGAYWTTFTLDIVMTNTAGCSYCDDPLYDNQIGCEAHAD